MNDSLLVCPPTLDAMSDRITTNPTVLVLVLHNDNDSIKPYSEHAAILIAILTHK